MVDGGAVVLDAVLDAIVDLDRAEEQAWVVGVGPLLQFRHVDAL